MISTRNFTCLAAALLVSFHMSGGVKDSVNVNIREYKDEIGFYQKANRDLGDPRFMLSDPAGKIDFGIGGTAKITSFYGFGGQSEDFDFVPSAIYVPTVKGGLYNMSVGGTEVHFKARTYIGKHKMSAFIKLNGNSDKEVEVDQAYISYDNFSMGLIPSFFTDLEVGVMTTGLGFNTQVDVSHPLIGYTWRIKDSWNIAAALEWPELDLDHYAPEHRVGSSFQPFPDIAMHIKHRSALGHIQFGTILRNLTYRVYDDMMDLSDQGENRYAFGFGLSFSGNYKPSEKLKFSWELTSGAGYAGYLKNFTDIHMDLGLVDPKTSPEPELRPIPVTSDQLAVQYDFSKSFSSSMVLGYTYCGRRNNVSNFENISESMSFITNFFWNINEYSYMGIEYLYGRKTVRAEFGEPDFGHAHRLAVVLAYCF